MTHPWLDKLTLTSSRLGRAFENYKEFRARVEEAQRPCPSDGRCKGRRRYGYKRFPSGDRRGK